MATYVGKETLLEYIGENIPDGYHTLQTTASGQTVNIDVEFINYYTDYTASLESNNTVVPLMTSNTTPSGVARSSTFLSGYEPFRAFNRDVPANGVCWATNINNITGWLEYEFPEPRRITAYSLTGQVTAPNRSPRTWTIMASNDGVTWDTLDTQTNITGWVNYGYKTFAFKNTKEYKIYRINITSNNGDSQYVCIGEMNFYNNTYGDMVADQRMLVLKFHRNLEVPSGTFITPLTRKKGMLIYVGETLTNNGTITMTARGANAAGQNVYMFRDTDSQLCFIPAAGAAGRAQNSQGAETAAHTWALPGFAGTGRQLGGGAPGAGRNAASGTGAAATSYSGGAGGGGSNTYVGGAGAANGGAGGIGRTISAYSHSAGGGAGNPGGAGDNGNRSDGMPGGNGTGGLLIIYSKDLVNNGVISANGTAGGNGYRAGGGGSGGGHVEIATPKTATKVGTIQVSGGAAGVGTRGAESGDGGIGGAGTFAISIVTLLSDRNILIEDPDGIKTYTALGWSLLGPGPATDEMFELGINDIRIIPDARWKELATTVKVLMRYKGTDLAEKTMRANTVPFNQLVLPIGDMNFNTIRAVNQVTLASTGDVKLIISIDGGNAWVTYKNGQWIPIAATPTAAAADGITPAQLSTLTAAVWEGLLTANPYTVRFAYCLVDAGETDELAMLLDMQGTWDEVLEGISYTAELMNVKIKVKLLEDGTYKINY
ncbi:F5/8 type C domain protein [compost metagenome]